MGLLLSGMGGPRDKRCGKGWEMPPLSQFSLMWSPPRPYRFPKPMDEGEPVNVIYLDFS